MDKIEVSECCKAKVLETYRDNYADHHDPIAISCCESCGQECQVINIEVVDDLQDIITKDQVDLDLHDAQVSNSL